NMLLCRFRPYETDAHPAGHKIKDLGRDRLPDQAVFRNEPRLGRLEKMVEVGKLFERDILVAPIEQRCADGLEVRPRLDLEVPGAVQGQHGTGDLAEYRGRIVAEEETGPLVGADVELPFEHLLEDRDDLRIDRLQLLDALLEQDVDADFQLLVM